MTYQRRHKCPKRKTRGAQRCRTDAKWSLEIVKAWTGVVVACLYSSVAISFKSQFQHCGSEMQERRHPGIGRLVLAFPSEENASSKDANTMVVPLKKQKGLTACVFLGGRRAEPQHLAIAKYLPKLPKLIIDGCSSPPSLRRVPSLLNAASSFFPTAVNLKRSRDRHSLFLRLHKASLLQQK